MYFTVYIALFGWPLVTLILFTFLPLRKALLTSLIIAWLFLPNAGLKMPGFDYSKIFVTVVPPFLCCIMFGSAQMLKIRFNWMDIPIAIVCISPSISSLLNDLGLHDSITSLFSNTVTWGIPYLLGRIYLDDLEGVHLLAKTILVGGLIYVPLCLFEIRFSPQISEWVYGMAGGSFSQEIRYGGFRPVVFMQHGLAVGTWMMSASIIGVYLWKTQTIRRIGSIPAVLAASALVVTTILCKSTGAIILLAAGLFALYISWRSKKLLPLLVLILFVPTYLGLRITGAISTSTVENIFGNYISLDADREGSLLCRLQNEDIMIAKALERPFFGWGGWGRNHAVDDSGHSTITDSLWIIQFGSNGLVGLIALYAAFLLPAWTVWRRYPAQTLGSKIFVPVHALVLVQLLFAIDCLLNAMLNPLFVVSMGAITGLIVSEVPARNNDVRAVHALHQIAISR